MRDDAEEPMSHREVLKALTGILAAFFASMLAINIVMTALPVIVTELDGNQIQYSWVLTAALLANAASTPIWGKLADLMDKKRLIQISIVIFVLSSLIAGFATSMEMLIAGRLVQEGLAYAEAHDLKIRPTCKAFEAYVRKNPETHDRLAPGVKEDLGL